jgi:hypothetical protein
VATPASLTAQPDISSREAHQFTGVDAYELGTEWGINAGCGGMLSDTGLDQFFDRLPPHSLVRSWFYQPMATSVHTRRRDWRPLDRLVATAGRHGDYLVATLGDGGGVCDGANLHDLAWYQQGWQTATGFLVWNWVPDTPSTPSLCSFDLHAGDAYLAS